MLAMSKEQIDSDEHWGYHQNSYLGWLLPSSLALHLLRSATSFTFLRYKGILSNKTPKKHNFVLYLRGFSLKKQSLVFGLAFGSVECSYFSIKVHYFLCLTNTSLTGCHSIFFFYSNANTNFSKEGIKTLYNFLLFGQKKNISSTKNRMNILSSIILSHTESMSGAFLKMINFFRIPVGIWKSETQPTDGNTTKGSHLWFYRKSFQISERKIDCDCQQFSIRKLLLKSKNY